MAAEGVGSVTQPNKIGKCIYCGSTKSDLTNEHIIPFGFGNKTGDILHAASCRTCAKITSQSELYMLRTVFQNIRTVLQMKGRNKPAKQILQRVKYLGGTEGDILVPYDKSITRIGMPVFQPPTIMQGDTSGKLATMTDMRIFDIGDASRKHWYEEHNITEMLAILLNRNKDHSFEKFIVKVAYCAGVRQLGLKAVESSPVRAIILGQDDHFATWFGNADMDYFGSPASNNTWARYRVDTTLNGVVVSVQLFAFEKSSPVYHVVLKANSELV